MPAQSTSMPHVDRSAERDLAQRQCQWHGGLRDRLRHPKGVHVGGKRCLRLHLLSDPLIRLLVRLDQRATRPVVARRTRLAGIRERAIDGMWTADGIRVTTAGLQDFSTQQTVSRLVGGMLLDAWEWQARLRSHKLHGYCSAPLPPMVASQCYLKGPERCSASSLTKGGLVRCPFGRLSIDGWVHESSSAPHTTAYMVEMSAQGRDLPCHSGWIADIRRMLGVA